MFLEITTSTLLLILARVLILIEVTWENGPRKSGGIRTVDLRPAQFAKLLSDKLQ